MERRSIEAIVEALNQAGARYLVVGELAMGRPLDLQDIAGLESLRRPGGGRDA